MIKLIIFILLLSPIANAGLVESHIDLLTLIKRFEGFKPQVYNDIGTRVKSRAKKGFWTPRRGKLHIGYGHLLTKWELTHGYIKLTKSTWMNINQSITRADADLILQKDIRKFMIFINKHVTIKLNIPQSQAILSFVYNLGDSAFLNNSNPNKLLNSLNNGACYQVYIEMLRFTRAHGVILPGLVKRRNLEADLYLKGCQNAETGYYLRLSQEN